MKKFFLVSILMGMLPLSMVAQVDDLYFVPKKKSAKQTSAYNSTSRDAYYSGSNRSVDEYNRRLSSYEVIGNDTLNDIIEFSAVQGVYPDSIQSDSLLTEDFALTKRMQRFDDYNLSANAAFWEGYYTGIRDWDWGWHSPWFYNRYGWYGSWYDPWYYGGYSWADPWYWAVYGYGPYYYRYSYWGYPYFYDYAYYPYYYTAGGGRRLANSNYGHTGTIRLNGSTSNRNTLRTGALSGSRTNSLRERTVGNHRSYGSTNNSSARYSSGNTVRSNSGNFSGSRATVNTGSSSGSFSSGGSSTRSSGGGSFSSGGGGGGRSSGGGGSLGGRR